MNRDATIVQVAILLIIIAIVGVAVLQQQRKVDDAYVSPAQITAIQEGLQGQDQPVVVIATGNVDGTATSGNTLVGKDPVEILRSDKANLVKQYFRYIAEKNYAGACSLLSSDKCNATRPVAVESFSREFAKLVNGYEYINIKDYGFVAPSGKEIVCVKYSYRYIDDTQPGLTSEIMSFYLDEVGGELKITDRVCEKKYKDGRGLRDCPIQAAAEFCEGWVK